MSVTISCTVTDAVMVKPGTKEECSKQEGDKKSATTGQKRDFKPSKKAWTFLFFGYLCYNDCREGERVRKCDREKVGEKRADRRKQAEGILKLEKD